MNTRPVSYYALFKWWLLLSQHPGCHCNFTSLVTEFCLGTLAGDLGCFPLDREAYPSRNPFDADSDAPLPSIAAATDSVQTLIPDNYRRQIPRPVSCYALFKWWLLLSQHPGCHSNLTTLRTEV